MSTALPTVVDNAESFESAKRRPVESPWLCRMGTAQNGPWP